MFSLHTASTSLIYDTLNSQQVISFCNYVIIYLYCVRQNQHIPGIHKILFDRINEIEGIAGG